MSLGGSAQGRDRLQLIAKNTRLFWSRNVLECLDGRRAVGVTRTMTDTYLQHVRAAHRCKMLAAGRAVPSQGMQRAKLPQTESNGHGCSEAVFHGHGVLCALPPSFKHLQSMLLCKGPPTILLPSTAAKRLSQASSHFYRHPSLPTLPY